MDLAGVNPRPALNELVLAGPAFRQDSSKKPIDVTIETFRREETQVYEWLDGTTIFFQRFFAEGSPFDPASLRTPKGFPRKLFDRAYRPAPIDFHRMCKVGTSFRNPEQRSFQSGIRKTPL